MAARAFDIAARIAVAEQSCVCTAPTSKAILASSTVCVPPIRPVSLARHPCPSGYRPPSAPSPSAKACVLRSARVPAGPASPSARASTHSSSPLRLRGPEPAARAAMQARPGARWLVSGGKVCFSQPL